MFSDDMFLSWGKVVAVIDGSHVTVGYLAK